MWSMKRHRRERSLNSINNIDIELKWKWNSNPSEYPTGDLPFIPCDNLKQRDLETRAQHIICRVDVKSRISDVFPVAGTHNVTNVTQPWLTVKLFASEAKARHGNIRIFMKQITYKSRYT
ncbi:hypothetical protein CEXT_369471 [Caerostris extrusa]|uniref:Uncharacterized protein n=1 Tax=Caerostris extrusa TaxID=172846 RepID=A0AAV4SRZ9_CAEEX|nr:hypothetical protein CEXT_369471 [Caerostris extrusa]